MELEKLSEESLTRQPEEVFDLLSKLGEGSYGSVYKALHKESKQILAIKQVPVDTDLQEIIKEISIMQQCDSPYVVKYYGSYFKNTDLWIVMEYCGAGSVLDIMKLRGVHHALPKGLVKTLTESEIATILSDTLKGLEYLHQRKKIHRDVKAGNILLNMEGHAKLADFGVAGQLTDTMAKRNTVIGTPFWMAPEVIQEIGYDCAADIWSLGITCLEMAEGKAPYGEIHPMRAIFMIPTKPPPSFNSPDQWSPQFIDFVSRCLVKNPEERSTSSELLQHEFILNAGSPETLLSLIQEANCEKDLMNEIDSLDHDESSGIEYDGETGTMITIHDDQDASDLGTMVINEDPEDDTMKKHGDPGEDYKPAFLQHFEKKQGSDGKNATTEQPCVIQDAEQAAAFQRQFDQIAGRGPSSPLMSCYGNMNSSDGKKFFQGITENDFEILNSLGCAELSHKMSNLDLEMEREIDNLRLRYHAKRQPILDAIDQKRKLQQHF